MPQLEYEAMMDELSERGDAVFMHALVRTSLHHGTDNRPALLAVTDDVLFWGGSEATGGRFNRVPLKSIIRSSRAGRLLWECVEVIHMDTAGEKTIYICPFTGDPAAPRKDREAMEALFARLKGKHDGV